MRSADVRIISAARAAFENGFLRFLRKENGIPEKPGADIAGNADISHNRFYEYACSDLIPQDSHLHNGSQ